MTWVKPEKVTLRCYLDYAGRSASLRELARKLSMNFSTMWNHLDREGWKEEVEEALGTVSPGLGNGSEPMYISENGGEWREFYPSNNGSTTTRLETRPSHEEKEYAEAYEPMAPSPLGVDAEEDEPLYTLEDLDDLVAYERARANKLARQNRQLLGQLNDRETFRRSVLEEVRKDFGRKPVIRLRSNGRPPVAEAFEVHAPTADVHVGRYSWVGDSFGGDYDTAIACERIVQYGHEIAKWVKDQPGRCSRVYLTDLGDLLHALVGHTEHGTPLPQDTRSARVVQATLAAQREKIEIVRGVTDEIVVMGAQGNHDFILNLLFWNILHGHYADDPQVDVQLASTKQTYFTSGSPDAYTVHFLDHGTGVNASLTPKAREGLETTYKQIVPRQVRAGATAAVCYIGHLHHHQVLENNEWEIIRLPSMAESDDYETDLRLFSKPSAFIYRLDERGYLHSSRRVYF